MKKQIILPICIIATSAIQYFFIKNIVIQPQIITDLITFFSITFGFYVTSLSIFATSKHSAKLYKIIDTNEPKQTLLHTLVYNFRFGLLVILITIAYLIIIQMLLSQLPIPKLALNNYFALPFIGIVIWNLGFFIKMLIDLINFIFKEAENLK